MQPLTCFSKSANAYRLKPFGFILRRASLSCASFRMFFRPPLRGSSFRPASDPSCAKRWGSTPANPSHLNDKTHEKSHEVTHLKDGTDAMGFESFLRAAGAPLPLRVTNEESHCCSAVSGLTLTAAEAAALAWWGWEACTTGPPDCSLAVLDAAYRLCRAFPTSPTPDSKGMHYLQAYELLRRYHAWRGRSREQARWDDRATLYEALKPLELFFRALLIDCVVDAKDSALDTSVAVSANPITWAVCNAKSNGRIAQLLLEGLREWVLLREELLRTGPGDPNSTYAAAHSNQALMWEKAEAEFPLLAWLSSDGGARSIFEATQQSKRAEERFSTTPAQVLAVARRCAASLVTTPNATEALVLFWQVLQPTRGGTFAREASKLTRTLMRDRHRYEVALSRTDITPDNRGGEANGIALNRDGSSSDGVRSAAALEEKARFHACMRPLLSHELLAEERSEKRWMYNQRESLESKAVVTAYALCAWLRGGGGGYRRRCVLNEPREYIDVLSEVIAILDESASRKKKGHLLLAPCVHHVYANANQNHLLGRGEIPFAVWLAFDITQSLRELRAPVLRSAPDAAQASRGFERSKWSSHTLDAIHFLQKLLLLVDDSSEAYVRGSKGRSRLARTQTALQMLWYVILREACEGSFASCAHAEVSASGPAQNDSAVEQEITKSASAAFSAENREESEIRGLEKGPASRITSMSCVVLSCLVLPQYRPSLWRRATVNLFVLLLHQWDQSAELRRVFNKISKYESKRMNEVWDWIRSDREREGERSGADVNEDDAQPNPMEEDLLKEDIPTPNSIHNYVPALTLRSCEIILMHCTGNNNPSDLQTANEVIQYMLLSLRLLKVRQERFPNKAKSQDTGELLYENDEEDVENFVEKWIQRIQREFIPKLSSQA